MRMGSAAIDVAVLGEVNAQGNRKHEGLQHHAERLSRRGRWARPPPPAGLFIQLEFVAHHGLYLRCAGKGERT